MRHSEALDETVDERTLMPAWYEGAFIDGGDSYAP